MFGFLLKVTNLIWLLLNDLVQPFFEFMSVPFGEYLESSILPSWLVSLLNGLFPRFLESSPIEWFFSSILIVFIVISVVKFFTGIIGGGD